MPNALSLNVGDFFVESSTKKSWLIAKKSLTNGVRECLEASGDLEQTSLIRFNFTQSHKTPSHVDFDHIAFFVTSGFENLLELTRPRISHAFSRRAEKSTASVSVDTTFGISERTGAQGNIVKQIETADLEFIASKLELLSIATIAVGFLHSNLNPQNEKTVRSFFETKGFKVFLSSDENSQLNENGRWQNTLMNARKSLREEKIASELELLKSEYKNLKIERAGTCGGVAKLQPLEAHLYLGLESFSLRDQNDFYELNLSATSIIESGFYNTPEFSSETTTFDPGPMIMGKSFVPTLIDFLFVTGAIADVESLGISTTSADRAKPRILESVLAQIRNNQERKHIDIQKELVGLEKILGYRIWSEALRVSNFKRLQLTGPLATPGFLKILKAWRPQGVEVVIHE